MDIPAIKYNIKNMHPSELEIIKEVDGFHEMHIEYLPNLNKDKQIKRSITSPEVKAVS